MKLFIETDRLVMREMIEEDAKELFELDSDPKVHKYLGNKPVKNLEQSIEILKNVLQQYKDFGIGRWAVIDKKTNDFIGWSGLKFEKMLVKDKRDYYDLGYRFKRKYWGKGIASETAIESLKYGFKTMNLKEICAAAQVENIASNKILKKVGMKYIEQFDFEGAKCNWYKIEKSDWLNQQTIDNSQDTSNTKID